MTRGMQHKKRGLSERPVNFKKSIGKLVSFCRPYIPAILVAMACALASAVLTVIGPDKVSELTGLIEEGFLSGIDFEAVLTICYTLIAFYAASALLGLTQGLVMTTVNQTVSKNLRRSISRKINRLPMDYYNKTSFGDVLSRITNDVDTISETLQRSIVQMVSAAALFIGCLVMMFRTNWIMAVTAIAASLIGFAFVTIVTKSSQKYFIARQEWLGKINGHIEEVYSGHSIVRLYNAEEQQSHAFNGMNEKLYECNWKSQFFSGLMMPVMSFIGNFGYVAVCVVGAMLAMNDRIDFGVIVAFIIYVRLFSSPLSQIAQAMTSLQSTAAASERVFDFLEAPEMPDESEKTTVLKDVRGEVEFDHVYFGYDSDNIIIHDFCEHIYPGQKVAIVGPTGAGKTTMVNLLMRFYDVTSGEIKIDGVPTSSLTRENVHALFGMVLQDTWLFEGTIRENVVYGKENISDEQVERACRAVGMHHFIKTLPHGYDTVIDDKMNLSAGQKQLLTIARAMIENAPMIILDEATSSVDTRTEVLIQNAMDRMTQGRTSFVIAHRLSTIRNSDKILVMKDGNIIESGNHEELMAKGGFYADLYNSQFEDAS
ncbi:MAG: ABC transporter [Clostridiales bacterium]|nr:MAG: ABC transporter [Clostridiales bacterium]